MTYSTTWAIAVNETSGEPLKIRTNNTPTAIMPITEKLFNRSKMFSVVKNRGLKMVIIIHRKMMTKAM
jgi:hypothetical protein